MSPNLVRVRELANWGFDDYPHRPATQPKSQKIKPFHLSPVVLEEQTAQLQTLFAPYATRPDLLAEMSGLAWSLGIVDLRPLIAFQRRLAFSSDMPQILIPAQPNWPALLVLSFGPPKVIACESTHNASTQTLTLRSSNPNLHVRTTSDSLHPITIHAGSPFFEVACFQGRWFLRDGYHRAFALLQANIFKVPAVIVHCETFEELGAVQPWFFAYEILFSKTPPRVIDFLNDDFTLEYQRPPLIKTIRITIEETLTPYHPGETS